MKCRACKSELLSQLHAVEGEEGVVRFQCTGCHNVNRNTYILVPEDELRRLVLQAIEHQHAAVPKV